MILLFGASALGNAARFRLLSHHSLQSHVSLQSSSSIEISWSYVYKVSWCRVATICCSRHTRYISDIISPGLRTDPREHSTQQPYVHCTSEGVLCLIKGFSSSMCQTLCLPLYMSTYLHVYIDACVLLSVRAIADIASGRHGTDQPRQLL